MFEGIEGAAVVAPSQIAGYEAFLTGKRTRSRAVGLANVREEDLCPHLFDWQRVATAWTIRKGQAAEFADCGLGKTLMQLARADYLCRRTGGSALILTPLAVARQTQREGERFGIPVTACKTQAGVRPGVNVANYERLHHFDTDYFSIIELDESSILKNFTGKTKRALCDAFDSTPYRGCWTATPAPNDYLELGNHAAFLGVMPANEMLMRWFINDASEAGNYRLKEHARADFWRWVVSWALPISRPSDLSPEFSDEGYELPPLDIRTHIVGHDDEGDIFSQDAGMKISATSMHRVMRKSALARASKVADLVAAEPDESWAIWCNTDYEADAIAEVFPAGTEVRGSHKTDRKEEALEAFADGSVRYLVTKPSIAGFGMNWQHCRRMAFVGLSYSYEQFYQSLRRSWRFGQSSPVIAHVIHANAEVDVLKTINRKRADHEQMRREMVAAMRETGVVASGASGSRSLLRALPFRRETGRQGKWEMLLGDCCDTIRAIPDSTVGITVTSPPFKNLYIYSDHEADMGNCADEDEFFAHFGYLIPELLRVTIPGRLCVIHCKDLPLYKGRDGAMGLNDFPGAIRAAFERVPGWVFHSRVTIWKDPVTEMQRTKNHGLLYKELCKDSCGSRQGMADYLMVFRRWSGMEEGASFPDPVRSVVEGNSDSERFDTYIGTDPPDPTPIAVKFGLPVSSRDSEGRWPLSNPFPRGTEAYRYWSIGVWQRYASPVWMDVNQMRVLNGELARESRDEKHICPLQLDVIERAIALWSNPGDLVLDPFMGVGSTGVGARRLGRRATGLELKPSYFDHAVSNLRLSDVRETQMNLFDLLAQEAPDAITA